jgi:hypothetical protein
MQLWRMLKIIKVVEIQRHKCPAKAFIKVRSLVGKILHYDKYFGYLDDYF